MEDLVINNGLIVTPHGLLRGGLTVRDGRIVEIGSDASLPKARMAVDAEGNYVLPGVIDPHVHLMLGGEDKVTSQFETESAGAAIGGITTLLLFPPGDIEHRPAGYRRLKEIGRQQSFVDFKFHAYLYAEDQLEGIPTLIEEGITSAKLLLGYRQQEFSSMRTGTRAIDLGFAYKVMEMLATYGPPVLVQVHCEQPDVISVITKRLVDQGRNDFLAWAESRPGICEAMHAFSIGLISRETGCPVYMVHVSAKETVAVIRSLKQMGVKVYAETCPQFLLLTKNTPMGVLAKSSPPLRDEANIECLWQAVSEGVFDTIGTDSCVRQRSERERNGIWGAIPGFGSMGALLPLMMSEGVNKGRITIEQLARLTSENTARLWGIYPKKGALVPGADADIVIVDPDREWTLSADSLKSSSDYSVYEGKVVKGKATRTFVRGNLVAENGNLVARAPLGEYVEPLLP